MLQKVSTFEYFKYFFFDFSNIAIFFKCSPLCPASYCVPSASATITSRSRGIGSPMVSAEFLCLVNLDSLQGEAELGMLLASQDSEHECDDGHYYTCSHSKKNPSSSLIHRYLLWSDCYYLLLLLLLLLQELNKFIKS